MCDQCSSIHKNLETSHQLLPLDDSPTTGVMKTKFKNIFCEKHTSEEMKFYCRECKIPFCPTCIVKHNKHEICEIEEIAGSLKKQFVRYLDTVSERMANINERSVNVCTQIESFAKLAGKVKKNIIGRGEYLKRMIDTHTGELLGELNLHKQQVFERNEEPTERNAHEFDGLR